MSRYRKKRSNIYIIALIIILTVISFIIGYNMYISTLKKGNEEYAVRKSLNIIEENSIKENEIASVSAIIGNSINEVDNKMNDIKIENEIIKEENYIIEEKKEVEEKKVELKFAKPVDGNIINTFAKDTLIYSETLKEWITHEGIDIAAEKTSVVKASEEGKIKSIKNDPRYGLTVVIEHRDGFITSYSNLLTAEYISEGENVVKGQTIGTIGDTAAFEIAEEPHLHFEIKQNGEYVDPSLYIVIED